MKTPIQTLVLFCLCIANFSFANPTFHNSMKEGRFVYKDGSVYYGEFMKGLPEGTGTVQYASGNRYSGEWKDHAPQGEGVMFWTSGRKTIGIWNRGELVKELTPSERIQQSPMRKQKSQAI